MWLYKYLDKQTRTQVPTFRNFIYSNHDTLSMWFENIYEAPNIRLPYGLRLIQWIIKFCILFLFLYALIAPEGSFYQHEC